MDQGTVIVRHRFDREALAFLAIDEPKRDDEVEFYSAVVHLQGGPAGATRLVDTLCPPTTPPDACVLAQAELDVFVVDRDGAARELAASAWINACDRPLPAAVAHLKHRMLAHALERANGNFTHAARLLGLKRTTFIAMLKQSTTPEA